MKLKKCPECQSEAHLIDLTGFNYSFEKSCFIVNCSKCRCAVGRGGHDIAVESWNTLPLTTPYKRVEPYPDSLPYLIPCPFCASDDNLFLEPDKLCSWYRVACNNCHATAGLGGTPQVAAEEWNRRAITCPDCGELKLNDARCKGCEKEPPF